MGQYEALQLLIGKEGLNKQTEIYLDKLRSIEIETKWVLYGEFLDLIEEMYPDEFQEAFKRREERC